MSYLSKNFKKIVAIDLDPFLVVKKDPRVIPTRGGLGQLVLFKETGEILQKRDTGITTNWVALSLQDQEQARSETITLTLSNMSSKSFSLSFIPASPTSMELTPYGGPLQKYGIDYIYNGGVVSWDGLGLDGFLESGDKIFVRY